MAILEVKNIHKCFRDVCVLDGIDFTLEKGEVLAIIGSSGSGKTTLLRCLNFLERPDEGQIIVNDKVIFDAESKENTSEAAIRKNRLHFGLVFQSFNLFPQYTVIGNVTLAAKLANKERLKELKKSMTNGEYRKELKASEAEIDTHALELLRRVGLEEKADAYPYQLSGGQQQRVAIARALAMTPDILCFDEPTSALDPELTGEVLNVIRGLKSSDRTMIVVTHEMEFAKNVSDRVIFMANGVIEEMGDPKEVFENPKSEALKAFLSKALDSEYAQEDI
ncbi:MAG: amino acid ABC transporter ATP-binding protein [Lachnospiraceae bacterium]|nr:amino acid ABC transporter ATP-binding protein [Lachnospiraceae bacterium]